MSEDMEKASSEDISNVKIRTVLNQRFKKRGLSWKTVISFILVGILCFAAGVGVDRAFTRHRATKMLRNKPGIEGRMPMGRFNNKQFNNKGQQKSDKQAPSDKSSAPSGQ